MLTTNLTKDLLTAKDTTYFAVIEPNGVLHTYRVQYKPASMQYPDNYFVSYQSAVGATNPRSWTYLGRLDTFTFQVEATTASPTDAANSHKWKLLNRILARVVGDDHDAYRKHGYDAYPLYLVGDYLHESKPESVSTPQQVTIDTLRNIVESVPITSPLAVSGTMKVYAGSKHGLTPQQFLFCDAVYRLCESRYTTGGDVIVEEFKPEDVCKRFRSLDDVERFIEGRNGQLADMEVTHQ